MQSPQELPSALLPTLLQSLRPSFLLLTFACVFLGASTVIINGQTINSTLLLLVLLAALLAHISVNMLNEYVDFRTGLDLHTTRTPFNGGSGALPGNPGHAAGVLAGGMASILASAMTGFYLVWQAGIELLPLGILGMLLVLSYTPWLNRRPLLCLIAPGIGFGFVMVCGTQFVLQGEYTALAWEAALLPFFLTNNLLLLNQYPDLHADRKAGRYHFPIAYGIDNSNRVYLLFVLLSAASVAVPVATGRFPVPGLIALLPLPLALYAWHGARKYGENIGQHLQYGAANVAVSLLSPFLLALAFIAGGNAG